MAFVSQPEFVGRILKTLGIDDKQARGLSLHMHVNDLVRVDVEFLPSEQEINEVADALEVKRYVIVPLKEEYEAKP